MYQVNRIKAYRGHTKSFLVDYLSKYYQQRKGFFNARPKKQLSAIYNKLVCKHFSEPVKQREEYVG